MRKLLFVALVAVLAWPAAASAAKLSRADRAAVNRTLDAFVIDGVKREHPLAARAYVTGEMRTGSRAAWKRGDISVYPYQAGGTSFHGWTLAYRSGNKLGVDLLLHPKHRLRKKIGPILFHVDLMKHGSRWLVSNFQPGAVYTPEGKHPDMMASADLQPGQGGAGGRTKLGGMWLLVPGGVLGGGIAFGLGILLVKWSQSRRQARGIY